MFLNLRTEIPGFQKHDMLDRMDGISRNYEDDVLHMDPSKYDSRLLIIRRICNALEKCNIYYICGNGATSIGKKLTIHVKEYRLFHKTAMVTISENPNLQDIQNDIIQQLQQPHIDNCILVLDGFWWVLREEDFIEIGIPSPSKSFKIVYTSRNEDMCKKYGSGYVCYIDFLEDEEAWDLFTEIAGKTIQDLNLHETARKIVDECDGFRISILTIASSLKDKPLDVWNISLRKLRDSNRVHYINGQFNSDISDMEKVFSRIALSYDLLKDKEAKLFFLLCCLFPEDCSISFEDLVLFGKGLELFENADSMRQARDRVVCIIHKLKNSFLLLNGGEDDFVKVHHMCHDFGLALSSKSQHPYVVRYENSIKQWPLKRTEYPNCGAISILCKTIENHPVDLKCPNLHLLQLSHGTDSAQLPNKFFEGLKNLKVLTLSVPSLSQSLTVLEKLRALCITERISDNRYKRPRPRIGDLLGDDMRDLEMFSFSTARPYDDFPREIGLLRNLRFLRFNRERLKYIPPGVLSNLVKLEELYLPLDFINWGLKEHGGERMNASLNEIESLQLTALRIGVPEGSILAEKFVKSITSFHVFIGSHVSPDYEFRNGRNSKKLLEVFDVDGDELRVKWISALVWKSESLRLKRVRNLKSIITWKPNIEFPEWEKICISDCNELEYLVAGGTPWTSFSQLKSLKLFGLSNLKEIWQGLYLPKIEGSCFCNLGEIQIMFCRKLRCVFPLSVATQLRELQSLQICFCDEMEQFFFEEQINNDEKIQLRDLTGETTSTMNPTVTKSIQRKSKLASLSTNSITKRLFGRGNQLKHIASQKQTEEKSGKEDDAIIFPQLKTMELAYLDRLRVFYGGNNSILLPSLQSLSIFQCNRLGAFCYGSIRTPLLQHLLINGNQYSVPCNLNAIVKSVCTIRSLS